MVFQRHATTGSMREKPTRILVCNEVRRNPVEKVKEVGFLVMLMVSDIKLSSSTAGYKRQCYWKAR